MERLEVDASVLGAEADALELSLERKEAANVGD
jgi:hypothetical protein